jgi:Na+-transporting NADH:ubiquinone oxidoreductase subunit NqrF
LPQSRPFLLECSVNSSSSPLKNNHSGGLVDAVFNSADGFKNMGLNNIPSYTLSGLNYNHVTNQYESKFATPDIKNVTVKIDDCSNVVFTNNMGDKTIPYIANGTFGDNFLNDYPAPKLYDGEPVSEN